MIVGIVRLPTADGPPLAANALAVTVGLLVLHRPTLVDDLGFRLTASATAGSEANAIRAATWDLMAKR